MNMCSSCFNNHSTLLCTLYLVGNNLWRIFFSNFLGILAMAEWPFEFFPSFFVLLFLEISRWLNEKDDLVIYLIDQFNSMWAWTQVWPVGPFNFCPKIVQAHFKFLANSCNLWNIFPTSKFALRPSSFFTSRIANFPLCPWPSSLIWLLNFHEQLICLTK